MTDDAPPGVNLRLVRRAASASQLRLDPSQRSVLDAVLAGGPVMVLGAPGTGKTGTLVEAVVARVERGTPPSGVLMLAADRRAASSLRNRVTARLVRTMVDPVARTPASYAFSLIRADAVAHDEPLPRLITGPKQDAILAEILAGHAAGEGRNPGWPPHLREALQLKGFRHELRDLLMRAMERGLMPQDLADLGEQAGRPVWVAAASLLEEYLQVTALGAAGAYDPAAIVDAAVFLLESDPELLERERRRWSLVAVDDFQEAGEAVARLLDCLRPAGTDLVIAGDPDATTQSFRGASPSLMAQAATRYPTAGGGPAPVHVLERRWRTPRDLMPVVSAVASSIGVVGSAAARRALAGREGGELRVGIVASAFQQTAWIARLLRDQHLMGEVEWSQMAVIARTGSLASSLRRALTAADVPTRIGDPAVPLRDEPAVRPLRLAVRGVLQPSSLTPQVALELMSGPLGGADPLTLRRVRRWLVAAAARDAATGPDAAQSEGAGAGDGGGLEGGVLEGDVAEGLSSGELLSELLRRRQVAVLEQAPEPVRAGLSPLLAVLTAVAGAASSPGADAETVLWAAWEASGLARRWRDQALTAGAAGRRADRDLDAVMALFAAAERFVDRNPGSAPLAFLDLVEAQEVPEDTLAAQASAGPAVEVLTPQTAAGREWEVVVLAGLNEGVWPDTRLRGSLLGSSALVDLVTGREENSVRAARQEVLADERRLFHVAVTRSTRLLAACAISTEEEQPSEFLDVLHQLAGGQPEGAVEYQRDRVPRPASLAGVVAELRRVLLAAEAPEPEKADAAMELARLAAAGVPGADPAQWYGLAPLTDDGPLWESDRPVPVSPSSLETYRSCPLRWLLQRHGGQGPATTRQTVGVLVHDVASELPAGSLQALEEARAQRFDDLGLPQSWIGRREDERSSEMVRKLAGYFTGVGRELLGTEVDFSVRIGRAQLRGRVDRLERDADGRLVVVDLKTGTRQPARDTLAEHPQLGAYQAAVEAGAFAEAGTSSGGAVLVQLGGSQKAAPEQGQPPVAEAEDPHWARRLVSQAAEGMAGLTFQAIRNEGCRHCSVRASCPVQQEGRQVR